MLMPAYNHGKYIRQAIESFLAQRQVDAELLIGNDASTDDTLQIAQEYASLHPDRIRVISNSRNLGLIGNYRSLVEHSSARYLAILESDDYWTDPLKLHRQVAWMEGHPECGLVFTSGEYVDEAGNPVGVKREVPGERRRCNSLLYSVLMANPVLAVTACFRREAFDAGCRMEDFVERGFVTFDYPVWIGLASCSDFYVMEEVTAAYRVSGASISNNASYEKREAFQKGIDEIVRYALEKYGAGNGSSGDGLSTEACRVLLNERLAKHMILALAFNKFERYSYFCKGIDPKAGLKWTVMRYLPWVFRFKKRKLIGSGTVHRLQAGE